MSVPPRPRSSRWLLPVALLGAPFFNFLQHHRYDFWSGEVAAVLGSIILVALACSVLLGRCGKGVHACVVAILVSLFVDIQLSESEWVNVYTRLLLLFSILAADLALGHGFSAILATTFAAMGLASIITYASMPAGAPPFSYRAPGHTELPRVIHLVLDEHIGVGGLSVDGEHSAKVKNTMIEFYRRQGFQLYGRAYSRYSATFQSLSQMLNFSADPSGNSKVYSTKQPYKMVQNHYFSQLAKRGYQIKVLWPGWIDFCSADIPTPLECYNYESSTDLRNLGSAKISLARRILLFASAYLRQSGLVRTLVKDHANEFAQLLARLGITDVEPLWLVDNSRTMVDSLNSLSLFDDLQRRILAMPRGAVLFAHLLFPHYPYVAQNNCAIVAPQEKYLWLRNGLFSPEDATLNSAESQRQRTHLYYGQLQCLYLQLEKVFAAMKAAGIYDDSIILLHGDHGSRIALANILRLTDAKLSDADAVAYFSTLFSVKLPGKAPAYDERSLRPLEELLTEFVRDAGIDNQPVPPASSREPFIYVPVKEQLSRVPFKF